MQEQECDSDEKSIQETVHSCLARRCVEELYCRKKTMLYQTTLSKTLTYVLPPSLKKTKSPVRMEEDLDEQDSDDVC